MWNDARKICAVAIAMVAGFGVPHQTSAFAPSPVTSNSLSWNNRRNTNPHQQPQHHQCNSEWTPTRTTTPNQRSRRRERQTRLRDICEWRDLFFDYTPTEEELKKLPKVSQAIPREVCVLPFPIEDVLLQGETKELHLYEKRFLDLFDECINNHCGVVAMGLITEAGIIQTVPLCEVETYKADPNRGIYATIRVVSRGTLLNLSQESPYIRAVCAEKFDQQIPSMDDASSNDATSLEHQFNTAADTIDNYMHVLTDLDTRLRRASGRPLTDKERSDAVKPFRRLRRLDHDDDDDDDDNDVPSDRDGRYRQAVAVAKSTDTQGYTVVSSSSSLRSLQDLTAISWAAFCSEDDSGASFRKGGANEPLRSQYAFRLQALDSNNLLERLKLALFMLREKRGELQTKISLASNFNSPPPPPPESTGK